MNKMLRFLALPLLLLCSSTLVAQLQNAQWFFGSGVGLDFTSNPPATQTGSTVTLNDRIASGISDASGNILFYVDHQTIYMADGNPMPNGVFDQFCFESVVIPNVGAPDTYYLIRSKNSTGLDYTLIDMSANDGFGAIVEGEKEVNFAALGGRLMVAGKEGAPGYWLISADNNNGSNNCFIRSYSVDGDGVNFNDQGSATWSWVGWNNELDDARLSPDCSLIAVTFKGHFFGLFRYDNEIGNITQSLNQSFDNFSSFTTRSRCEFSPNSEFLYSIGDRHTIKQFNVSTFVSNQIMNSASDISSCGFGNTCYYDLKLAVDGMIYIINPSTNSYNRIPNPDVSGSDSGFEADVAPFTGQSGDLFPNTPNLLCSTVFVVQPDVIEVCIGDPTEFSLSISSDPDEILWNFGDPNADEEANTSTELNPTYTYSEPGSYNVTVEVTYLDESYFFELVAEVYPYPTVTLEPSYVFCAGDAITISAGVADEYLWNTGAETQSIGVAKSGTYSVTMTNGICTETATTDVTVIPPVALDLGPNLNLCDEPPYTLSANQEVAWSTGVTASSIEILESGIYSAVVSNECFTVSDEVTITFIEEPDFGLPGRMSGCHGDTLRVQVSLPGGTVSWSSLDGEVSNSGQILNATESGTYIASINYFGCPFSEEVEIEFYDFVDLSQIEMPNIFSPNNDGINDVYRPTFSTNSSLNPCNIPVLKVDLRIYNRWGTQIIENACSWNGRDENGNDLSEGVYFYIIDMSAVCLERSGQRSENGTINLVR